MVIGKWLNLHIWHSPNNPPNFFLLIAETREIIAKLRTEFETEFQPRR